MKLNLTLIYLLLSASLMHAQSLKQTIRGRVVDAQSGAPVVGANLFIVNSNPMIGAATDLEGYFALEQVPLGRQAIKISYVGYKERVLSNIVVTSGKEVVLDISLEEQVVIGEEIVITATPEKAITNNELTTVSSRSFNLEEASRYAGSRNDPARMAANFAGVSANNDDRNDIIIRGNSPSGLLWRLEGINIPNPSHYGSLSSTGGPVSIINYNNLDKSDFLTAAFPAEYGNAIAGVFDLQLRDGNSRKREYLGQIGFNGFELGVEGPFSKKSRASYIANYRYSTLGVFNALGINFGTGSAIPQYQDLTFKVSVPTKKMGKFTVFGIGGKSNIDLLGSEEDLESGSLYGDENEDNYADYQTGIMGVSHLYYFNSTTYYKLSLAASRAEEHFYSDSLSIEDRTPIPNEQADFINNKYSANLLFSKKFNARNLFTMGAILDLYDFNLENARIVPGDEHVYRNNEGQSLLTQAYVQWQHKFTDKLTLNTGLNFEHFEVSNSKAMEPRAGLRYQLNNRHEIGIAYGYHSQIQPLVAYYTQTKLEDGSVVLTNKNMDFVHSQHYVLSYDYMISADMHIKVETYYQDISNAAVESVPSSFSMLNAGADFSPVDEVNLVNKGTGRNYGFELTLEKYYSKGYYFLLTTSLFDAKYRGSDEVLRKTAFNGRYIVNLLGGKEFKLGKKDNTLNIDLKLSTSGGRRYTPIDFEKSAALKTEVRIKEEAYSLQTDPYFRADLKFSYKINRPKLTHEFAIDLQNVTNHQNVFANSYNPRTNSIQTQYQIGFFPIPQYRITF